MKERSKARELSIYIITAHGREELTLKHNERIIDALIRYQIPWSSVSIYAVREPEKTATLFSGLDLLVSELDHDISGLQIYINRNVNPFIFSLNQFNIVHPASGENQNATEYFYQSLNNDTAQCKNYLKKLSSEECLAIVSARVKDTIQEQIPANSKLVVGVSGGGDSNALLYSLAQLQDTHGLSLYPVIMKGIPEWDAGVPRAMDLCEKYKLNLTVMEADEGRTLLNIPQDSHSLIERFEKFFVGDDFEALGTLIIRLALMKHAQQLQTAYFCTGVNLEDGVAENLFRMSSGMKPASYPKRVIGEMNLIYPLWLCPKRIIDGCFPKYSLENYQARYPCVSLGRNFYYSIVFAMQSQFPGFVEKMASGLSELSQKDPVEYRYDEQFGFHVERFIPFPLRKKFEDMRSFKY